MLEVKGDRSISQKEEIIKGARRIYCQILGCKDVPESSRHMPDRVFLPPNVLGEIEGDILETVGGGNEIRRRVTWDPNSQGLRCSNPLRGSKDSVSVLSILEEKGFAGIQEVGRFFEGQAVLEYHTEPPLSVRERKPPRLNQIDVASHIVSPDACIELVGSQGGISCILETKTSLGSKLRSLGALSEVQNKLRGLHLMKPPKAAQKLEEFGLAYYTWRTEGGRIKRRDLAGGITVTRIKPRK